MATTQPVSTLPDTPSIPERTRKAIETTLLELEQEGIKQSTTTSVKKRLVRLAKTVNLFQPMETTVHVLQLKRTKGYQTQLLYAYNSFCKTNQIPFDMPRIHYEPPVPIIPTTEQVNMIIGSAERYTTALLTILSEIAVEGEELHQTSIRDIDLESGRISIKGTKGHSGAVYKLKPRTADMLRQYLATRQDKEHPFPQSRDLSKSWRTARRKAATKLCRPDLLKIPMKNLRNYAGAVFYKTTGRHDPIATMRFMRHKKLETTLSYIRSINLDEPEEYTTQIVKLGEPDTLKRIKELSDAGYQFLCEADGHQAFRIRKS